MPSRDSKTDSFHDDDDDGDNNNKATLALFLDTERDFDKVWTTGLISKVIKQEIPGQLIHLIHNYLITRPFTVHGNFESTRHTIQTGVHHGSLLVPVLFDIYMTYHLQKMTTT
jgi:hypothetical protein